MAENTPPKSPPAQASSAPGSKKSRSQNLSRWKSQDMTEDQIITHGWHHTFGWLRRSELDKQFNGYVYEDGDGDLIISRSPRHAVAAYLDCWQDAITGERYLCFSKLPRVRRRKNASH